MTVSSCGTDDALESAFSSYLPLYSSDAVTQGQLLTGMGSFEGRWYLPDMRMDGEMSVRPDTLTVRFPSEMFADYIVDNQAELASAYPGEALFEVYPEHRNDWQVTETSWELPYEIVGYSEGAGYLNMYNNSPANAGDDSNLMAHGMGDFSFEIRPTGNEGGLDQYRISIYCPVVTAKFDISARQWVLVFPFKSIDVVNQATGWQASLAGDRDMTLVFITTKKIR